MIVLVRVDVMVMPVVVNSVIEEVVVEGGCSGCSC